MPKNSFIYLFKKYWYLVIFSLVFSIPILYITCKRTNYAIITKGDTTVFNSVLEIEDAYEQKGSFSTIYVTTLEHSTVFQNYLAKHDPSFETYKMSEAEIGYTPADSNRIGKMDYASSITRSIILAYTEAKKQNSNINIDYNFNGYYINYKLESSSLCIGDYIYGIKLKTDSEFTLYNDENYKTKYNNSRSGDTYLMKKYSSIDGYDLVSEDDTFEYVLSDDDFYTKTVDDKTYLYRAYSYLEYYKIDNDTLKPSIKYNKVNVGGPSGGTLQALSIYNALVEEDITHGYKIAGTGTISIEGKVGGIGGIKEKVPTALDDNIKIFFCPSVNYDDALKSYNNLLNRSKMKLVKVDTFYDCINYLEGLSD
ncbi:MAG: hypothetical protein K5892_07100 [Acholeplasmatales bacterium]|nr:hypothetical protein [Acholeplasmatales bacterium]